MGLQEDPGDSHGVGQIFQLLFLEVFQSLLQLFTGDCHNNNLKPEMCHSGRSTGRRRRRCWKEFVLLMIRVKISVPRASCSCSHHISLVVAPAPAENKRTHRRGRRGLARSIINLLTRNDSEAPPKKEEEPQLVAGWSR